MPRFDGTGPRGEGPITGRGEGYCAVALPESGEAPYGYAGLQGIPVRQGVPTNQPTARSRFTRWLRPAVRRRCAFGRGRGRGGGRGRGRWLAP
jgi:hypothetical protein